MHHPWLCGFLLAVALVASQVLTVPLNLLDAADEAVTLLGGGDAADGPLLPALAVTAGALIASIPGRLRAGNQPRMPVSIRRCAACYAGGLAAALGLSLAGGDLLVLAFQGSFHGTAGGLVFAGVAVLSAGIAASIAERRRT